MHDVGWPGGPSAEEPLHVDDRLVDALVRASFAVTAALSTEGSVHHLSLSQVRVLGILRDRQLRMAQLAGYLGLERSTLTGLVDRAEQRGLLARTRAEADGRSVQVGATDGGRALARAVHGNLSTRLAPLLGRLSGAQQSELAELLDRLLGPAPSELS